MSWREDYLGRLHGSASSFDAMVQELGGIVGDLGFEYCSYVLQSPVSQPDSGTRWSSTYPTRWLKHYFAHDYLSIDSLIRRIVADHAPVAWSDDIFKTEPTFWEEARSHQIRHGWGLATYGKNGTRAILSLARSAEKVTPAELEHIEGKLVWLSHAAHGMISTVQPPRPGQTLRAELTPREQEVLRWTASGKTTHETSIILGTSERAVTFHISNCLAKLNAVNKTQAVCSAILLGLLF